MTFNRAVRLYGDELQLYAVSIYILLFGTGWIIGRYWEMGFGDILFNVIALSLVVHFVDAIIKSVFFVSRHFKISLSYKQ